MSNPFTAEYLQDLAGSLSPVTGRELAAILRDLQAEIAPGLFTESYLQDLEESFPAVPGRDLAGILRALQVELALSLFTEEYLRDLEQTAPTVFGGELVILLQVILDATAVVFTYATWNPADKDPDVLLSGGNLTATFNGVDNGSCRSTIGKPSGKWFWEVTAVSGASGDKSITGIMHSTDSVAGQIGYQTDDYGYEPSGVLRHTGSPSQILAAYTNGDVIGAALDLDAFTLRFYKNGVAQGSPQAISAGPWFAGCGQSFSAGVATANFGATPFAFAVPPGFNAGLFTTA